jgi:hypothetical protein
MLNEQTHNEKEFEETMNYFDEKTTVIKPEETEYYIEGIVMKNLHDKR